MSTTIPPDHALRRTAACLVAAVAELGSLGRVSKNEGAIRRLVPNNVSINIRQTTLLNNHLFKQSGSPCRPAADY